VGGSDSARQLAVEKRNDWQQPHLHIHDFNLAMHTKHRINTQEGQFGIENKIKNKRKKCFGTLRQQYTSPICEDSKKKVPPGLRLDPASGIETTSTSSQALSVLVGLEGREGKSGPGPEAVTV
jgi:hypothetical protein